MTRSKSLARTVRHLQGPNLAPHETLVRLRDRQNLTRPSYEQVLSRVKPGYRTLRRAAFQAGGSTHLRRIMAGDYLLHQLDAAYRQFERDVQVWSAHYADRPDIAGKPREWMDRRLIPFHQWNAISYPELSLCDELEAMLVGMSEKGVFATRYDLPLSAYWCWPISLEKERTFIAALLFSAHGEKTPPAANEPHSKGEKQLARLYAPSPDHNGELATTLNHRAGGLVVRTTGGEEATCLAQVIYGTGYPFAIPKGATANVSHLMARLESFWWAPPAERYDLVALNLQQAQNPSRPKDLMFARTHWGHPLTIRF